MLSLVRTLKVLAAVYLAGVLTLTLWPGLAHTEVPRWAHGVLQFANHLGIPLTFDVLEAVANVLMFVPLGAFGIWIIGDWREIIHKPEVVDVIGHRSYLSVASEVVLAAAVLSAAIEVAQLRIPGRVTSFDDWWRNTLGAAVGTGIGLATLVAHRRRLHRRLGR